MYTIVAAKVSEMHAPVWWSIRHIKMLEVIKCEWKSCQNPALTNTVGLKYVCLRIHEKSIEIITPECHELFFFTLSPQKPGSLMRMVNLSVRSFFLPLATYLQV